MDLVKLVDHAWNMKKQYGYERTQEMFKNSLSYPYGEILNEYVTRCQNENKPSSTIIIYKVFENIIVHIMKCDDDFLQGEYDAYVKFAKYCGYRNFSADDIRNMSFDRNTLIRCINKLKSYRFVISEENYESMIQGFCHLIFLGDNAIDENEYYILRCFLDDAYDKYPSDWESFKREW